VHVVYKNCGNNNYFAGNKSTVNGPGYGFYVQPGAVGTYVSCNQVVEKAGAFSNVKCQQKK